MLSRILAFVAQLLAVLAVLPAGAQTWPEREITLMVPYGAGGSTDILTRIFARHLQQALGRPVVVQNKPGAQGTLASEWVAWQKPDGYSLAVITASANALAPHLVPVKFGMDDLVPVGAMGGIRFGVSARVDAPYKTLQELIAAAKTKEGVFLGAGAPLTAFILTELNATKGTNFQAVPFKSGTEAANAVLAGTVPVMVGNPTDMLPFINAGRMRLLASGSPARWPEMPDVPSMAELGYGSTANESWVGLAAPKGTPREVVARLEAASAAINKDADYIAQLNKLSLDPIVASSRELEDYLRARYTSWGAAVKQGILK